jgi:hypothetical protein
MVSVSPGTTSPRKAAASQPRGEEHERVSPVTETRHEIEDLADHAIS